MRIVQIDARSADIVLKRNFREDSDVKAGQILYQIDPAPLQESYSNAQAVLAKTEVNLTTSIRKA
jgi:membrane fusion protein, multidrug efflux system